MPVLKGVYVYSCVYMCMSNMCMGMAEWEEWENIISMWSGLNVFLREYIPETKKEWNYLVLIF